MNNYYASPISPEEAQSHMAAQQRGQQRSGPGPGRGMPMINTSQAGMAPRDALSAMSDMPLSGGDSLDDMVRQNASELHRRRSVPHHFTGSLGQDGPDRRLSMLDFHTNNDAFQDFQFGNLASPTDSLTGGFGGMPGHSGTYAQSGLMAMSGPSSFPLSPDIMGNMMAFSNLNMGSMAADPASLNMFGPPSGMGGHYPPTTLGSVDTDFVMDMGMSGASGGGMGSNEDLMGVEEAFENPGVPQRPHSQSLDSGMGPFQGAMQPPPSRELSVSGPFRSPTSGTMSQIGIGPSPIGTDPSTTPVTPSTSVAGPAPRLVAGSGTKSGAKDKSVYSRSGFDMLRALWYVATRKNAKLNIGAVDMSCAFVVCDVKLNDCPIIYVSDNFQNLTGYNRHEIVGKNCRFLQSPSGNVTAGSRREYVENDAVYRLKVAIARGEEIQQSLINYRKGGKPFLNLLTMIPIPWDTDDIRYFIGFQIDLVECPDAISGQEPTGVMMVDYKNNPLNPYIFTPPRTTQFEPESGQTLGTDDVSNLLQQFNPKGHASDWHKQSWDKMLLENADDVIHVLSLKGNFLYLSPSCKKVLGYDVSQLLHKPIENICHPSDIIPVLRELKDAQLGSPVNLVYRVQTETGHSGIIWFEAHGTLFAEAQGKGRKCVILVGRKRPVPALSRAALEAHGGIGDGEIWSQLSTSGMFLFVSSSVRSVLDLMPGDLEGTSMQDLMRKETRGEFGRAIETAKKGKITTCKHDIQNKRGQVLQAQTTFYPGDVPEGQKPSFLVAQTKLLKASSRAIAPAIGTNGKVVSTTGSVTSDEQAHPAPLDNMAMSRREPQMVANAVDDLFDEMSTTRCTSWQYELRQMERANRALAEELAQLLSNKKKRKRRKGGGNMVRDCANCHTRNTPEWRRGPSGNRDLCNSCGLRWAKQTGRVSPRNSSRGGNGDAHSKKSNSPVHSSPLHREMGNNTTDSPPLDAPSKSTSASVTPSDTAGNMPPTPVSAGASGSSVPASDGFMGCSTEMAGIDNSQSRPPQSQPMLEGGSGTGGAGMQMTSILEEREMGV